MAATTFAHAPAASTAEPPLSAAYARLMSVLPMLRITEVAEPGALPGGEGWVSAEALASDPAVLDRFLAQDGAQMERDYARTARPDVVASFSLHRYAWPATLLITAPWFLLRRVPRFGPGDVSFHRDTGRIRVRAETFACLPDDPAAQRPQARVVAGEEALRAEVREAVAAHLGPVLDAFRPRMRRGPRALWGAAADEIVEGLWYVGRLLGEEERAVAETSRLLPGATGRYPGGAAFRELTAPGGQVLTTRDRSSCCLFYTLRPEDTCVTCPRTCDSSRIERLTGRS